MFKWANTGKTLAFPIEQTEINNTNLLGSILPLYLNSFKNVYIDHMNLINLHWEMAF